MVHFAQHELMILRALRSPHPHQKELTLLEEAAASAEEDAMKSEEGHMQQHAQHLLHAGVNSGEQGDVVASSHLNASMPDSLTWRHDDDRGIALHGACPFFPVVFGIVEDEAMTEMQQHTAAQTTSLVMEPILGGELQNLML